MVLCCNYLQFQSDLFVCVNKDNSSIPVFKSHKSIERNNSGLQTKTEGNTSTTVRENKETIETMKCNKTNANIHRNELFDNSCHMHDLVQDIIIKWWVESAFMTRKNFCIYDNVQKYR